MSLPTTLISSVASCISVPAQPRDETFRRVLNNHPELSLALRDAPVDALQEALAKVVETLSKEDSSSSSFGIFAAADSDPASSRTLRREIEQVCAALILAAMKRKQHQPTPRAASPQIIHSPPKQHVVTFASLPRDPSPVSLVSASSPSQDRPDADDLSPFPPLPQDVVVVEPQQHQQQRGAMMIHSHRIQQSQQQQQQPEAQCPSPVSDSTKDDDALSPFPSVLELSAVAESTSKRREWRHKPPEADNHHEKQQQQQVDDNENAARITLFQDTPQERSGELIGASTLISVVGEERVLIPADNDDNGSASAARESSHIDPPQQPSSRDDEDLSLEEAMKLVANNIAVRRQQGDVSRSRRSWVHQPVPSPPAFAEEIVEEKKEQSPEKQQHQSPQKQQQQEEQQPQTAPLPPPGRAASSESITTTAEHHEFQRALQRRILLLWWQRTATRRCCRAFQLQSLFRKWQQRQQLSMLLRVYQTAGHRLSARNLGGDATNNNNSGGDTSFNNDNSGVNVNNVSSSTTSIIFSARQHRRQQKPRSPHDHFLLAQSFRHWQQNFQSHLLSAQRSVSILSTTLAFWRRRSSEAPLVRALVALRAFHLASVGFRTWRARFALRVEGHEIEVQSRAAILSRKAWNRWRRRFADEVAVREFRDSGRNRNDEDETAATTTIIPQRPSVLMLKRKTMHHWLVKQHHTQAQRYVETRRKRTLERQVFDWWRCRLHEKMSNEARIVARWEVEQRAQIVMRFAFNKWAGRLMERKLTHSVEKKQLKKIVAHWRKRALLKRHTAMLMKRRMKDDGSGFARSMLSLSLSR